MKIQTLTITIILLLLATVSATYSGDSYSFPSEEFEYFEVVGNSSNIDGMEISWENNYTTISFDIAYKSDNFTVVLFNIEKEVVTEVVVEHHYSGGGGSSGGSRTKYVDRNVTRYVDRDVIKEVEVKGDIEIQTIIEEKIVEKIPLWMIITLPILLMILIISIWSRTKK